MMGGIIRQEQVEQFNGIMEWDSYTEEENIPDEIKLTLLDEGYKNHLQDSDNEEVLLLIFYIKYLY